MTGKLSDFDWLLQCQRLLSQLLRKRPSAALKAGKNTLAVRKVRGGWLTGRPQYATACLNLLNQTSRQQQQRAKLGHIYRWEKKSAHIINKVVRHLLHPVFHPSCLVSKKQAGGNCVGVYSRTNYAPDTRCWASFECLHGYLQRASPFIISEICAEITSSHHSLWDSIQYNRDWIAKKKKSVGCWVSMDQNKEGGFPAALKYIWGLFLLYHSIGFDRILINNGF